MILTRRPDGRSHIHGFLSLLLLVSPVVGAAKFYTGNVTQPASMREIFIDQLDWPSNSTSLNSTKVAAKVSKNTNETTLPLLEDGLLSDSSENSTSLGRYARNLPDFSLLCSEGIPLLREDDRPKKCNPNAVKTDESCPSNFWCHIGSSAVMFFCCPKNRKITNLCHLPPNSGYGSEKLIRYWYDWRSRTCRDMTYTGYGGNENNFVMRELCELRCHGTPLPPGAKETIVPMETVVKSIIKPKNKGTTTTAQPKEEIFSTAGTTSTTSQPMKTTQTTTKRPAIVITSTQRATVSLHRLTRPVVTTTEKPTTTTEVPKIEVTSPTTAKKPIVITATPATIAYTTVNTPTLTIPASRRAHAPGEPSTTVLPIVETTTQYIEQPSGNLCSLSPDRGVKSPSGIVLRWYFDLATERCVKFQYHGAKGNANNFLDEDTCIETCGGGPAEVSSCAEPVESGDGPYAIPRYYFNSKSKKCRRFVYKGKGGNSNRFVKRSSCEKVCVKKEVASNQLPRQPLSKFTVPSTTPPQPEPFAPAAFGSNSMMLTPEMLQGLFELQKLNLIKDPFAIPDTTTTTQQPSEEESEDDDEDPFEMYETTEATPSESMESTTEAPQSVETPPSDVISTEEEEDDDEDESEETSTVGEVEFPIESSFETTTKTTSEAPSSTSRPFYRSFPKPSIAPLSTTTTAPRIFPTLIPEIIPFSRNSVDSTTLASPFGQHYRHIHAPPKVPLPVAVPVPSEGTVPKPPTVVPLPKAPGPIHVIPCRTAPTSGTLLQACRSEGPSGIVNGIWGQTCPQGTFCQVGETVQLSVCCPKEDVDACVQSMVIGSGPSALRRWYYDAASKQCKGFIFKGFQGNENNFPSYSTCLRKCNAINPCPFGDPYSFQVTNTSDSCVPSHQTCPHQHYCHTSAVGNVCCPVFNGTIHVVQNGPQQSQMPSGQQQQQAMMPSFVESHMGLPFGLGNLPNAIENMAKSIRENATVTSIPSENHENHHGSPLVGQPMGKAHHHGHHGHHSKSHHSKVGNPSRMVSTGPGRPGKAGSVCLLPMDSGNGKLTLHRWGFNGQTKACVAFVFTGSGGNGNNFLTKTDCINACVASQNPCASGSPLIKGNNLVRCSKTSRCPAGFYCHIGTSGETNVCCPTSTVSPCLLSLSTGIGSAIIHRYYFDSSTSTCKAFTYTGVGGNENNFLTIQDCRKTCPEYDNPCAKGKPYTNRADGSVGFCSASNPTCPQGYACHIGDSRQTTVCCPSMGLPCSNTVVLGTGSAQLPRYYYNSQARACVPFVYSGKGGNSNNFVSKSECEISCPVLDNPCSTGFPALDEYDEPVFCSISEMDECPSGYWCHIGSTQSTTLCCPGSTDACSLPMSRGTGTAVLNRWYFNSESKVCVSFVYTGRGGNQNNFMSRQECLATCPEYSSPCPTGQPHIGLSGQITHCGATDPSICPTTYWCHIGATLDTSVCCPDAADPCDQELETGVGSAQLLRYYYNQLSRTCSQFRYTGVGGNENNFLTKASCEARCPVFVNPCGTGDPEIDENMSPILCSAADNTTCSPGNWCHIGASEMTTICCKGASVEICETPRVSGSGDASLPRFHYTPLTKQCLPFIYSGLGGNQNNFLSKTACENTCEVLVNPCDAGDPAIGANGLYVTCSASSPSVCPAGYWCHIGADITEAVCCPGAEDPCSLPPSDGNGEAELTRWFFDTALRKCSKFSYSGIGGNQNNFLTLQDCQLKCPEFQSPCATGDPALAPSGGILFCSATRQTCPSSYWCHIGATYDSTVCCPSIGDPCLSAMQPGAGNAKLNRFYFNQNTRQCLQFTYTGSGGNANNFLTEEACASKCPVYRNPCPNVLPSMQLSITRCSAQNTQSCPSGYWCHIGGTADTSVCCPGASNPCRLAYVQGVASENGPYTRWYYDFTARRCKPFQYTGMGGNENNFLTREDCAQRCPEFVNPCFTGSPLIEPRTGTVRQCNSISNNDCPSNYFCHFGATADTTVCCPSDRNPCEQSLAIGTGPSTLARWYFNAHSRTCQEFVYTGIGGNANNFISRAACAQLCPEFSNPCGEGQPLSSVNGEVTYCSPQNRFICPIGYFCHVGAGADQTVCCPGHANGCHLGVNVGHGSATLVRYYFNPFLQNCQQFVYSGVGGNANNFLSLSECRQACPGVPTRQQESHIYPSPPQNVPMSAFGNRFASRPVADPMPFGQQDRKLCPQGSPLMTSSGNALTCTIDDQNPCAGTDYVCNVMSTGEAYCCPNPKNFCLQPATPGECPGNALTQHQSAIKYGYNPMTDSCQRLQFSGCGGNLNNFESAVECSTICCNKGYNLLYKLHDSPGSHDYSENPSDSESDSTTSEAPSTDSSPKFETLALDDPFDRFIAETLEEESRRSTEYSQFSDNENPKYQTSTEPPRNYDWRGLFEKLRQWVF
uniref:Kunitz/Bovine pancreatic trypsin inhibitor domain protein n=1 Tax=Panagrellus redivivus TaxID=6233 RepID=A0A7E4V4X8_PANRE